jgi:uncharacterized protein YndB with AHSA1/START domain
MMSEIRIVRDYQYPPTMVWRAVTDPELVARWTVTGQGGRPVGFAPIVGNTFQIIAKPVPGWGGTVYCQVLEVEEARLLRYTWRGEENGKPTIVSYKIEPEIDGTRFTFEHTGFIGIGGFFMARILGAVRRKMLGVGLPAVLDDLAKVASDPVPDDPQ